VLTLQSSSADETARFGAQLASLLRPGDVVLLSGDLGAGKTTLTQGLARALGVEGPVTSPTFVLVQSYRTKGGWDLVHADIWRLEQLREVTELAIPELLEEGAAAVIEWGEKAAPVLPEDALHITIEFVDEEAGPYDFAPAEVSASSGGSRRLVVSTSGPSWRQRLGELSQLPECVTY
jgi:tRNA threonylcarbamoyladenosine biosynthesis protein TsaE